ncbi:uncharacterized protein LOC102561689 isoform X1 [Alligator mississippiensis]|uniref:uncharacterized protein LOC102561689 isoform X1 n=1 Tax=Alligator mississippiensis TaxID=8496 RepID=UPI0009074EC8|nr:uncharacterized protein LOC102561689 isoform X1 [Alligator mississippiensis]
MCQCKYNNRARIAYEMSSLCAFQAILCAVFIFKGTSGRESPARGTVGDCVILDLNIHKPETHEVIWKKGSNLMAKITNSIVKLYGINVTRFNAFPNGSLSLCPIQWGDEGKYTADMFSQDGLLLDTQAIFLELVEYIFASVQEISGFAGGSVFLPSPEVNLEGHFHVTWKKENISIARMNFSYFEYYGEYANRSEIFSNGTLRLDRIEDSDSGRYYVEAHNGTGKITYNTISLEVEVGATEAPQTIDFFVVLYIWMGCLVAVCIIVSITLAWHCGKCKHNKGLFKPPSFKRANLSLRRHSDGSRISEEGGMSISWQNQDEDCHSGKGSTADSTKQGDKAFNQDVDAKAAVAAGVFNKLPVSLNISSFQGIEVPKSPPMSADGGNSVAFIPESCVPLQAEHCMPLDFEDCGPPDFPSEEYDDCCSPAFPPEAFDPYSSLDFPPVVFEDFSSLADGDYVPVEEGDCVLQDSGVSVLEVAND